MKERSFRALEAVYSNLRTRIEIIYNMLWLCSAETDVKLLKVKTKGLSNFMNF